uniref:Uncharacterized protein n=1 Tax=Oncorhynchus kisutch TaxID=8019 RepID=A0A8C7KC19_ONCKI
MEVNRDEAERCIDIATAALTNNQAEKAVRFLEKAQKLFPTDKARALLDLIAKNGFTPGHDNQSTSDGTGPRQRRPGEEDQGEKASQTAKSYTSDQLDAVKKGARVAGLDSNRFFTQRSYPLGYLPPTLLPVRLPAAQRSYPLGYLRRPRSYPLGYLPPNALTGRLSAAQRSYPLGYLPPNALTR